MELDKFIKYINESKLLRINNVQSKIIKEIVSAFTEPYHLLIEAPTAVGKTSALVIASLYYHYYENERRKILIGVRTNLLLIKIYYLLRRLIENLRDKFDRLNVSLYIGKEQICPYAYAINIKNSDVYALCNWLRKNFQCKYYNNFISNYWNALGGYNHLIEKLISNEMFDIEYCPYYTQIEVTKDSDIILTTYYHILFYNIHMKNNAYRLPILAIDEIHNIPRYFYDQSVIEINLEELTKIVNLYPNTITGRYLKNILNKIVGTDSYRKSLKNIFTFEELYDLEKCVDAEINNIIEKNINRLLGLKLRRLMNIKRCISHLLSHYHEIHMYKNGDTVIFIPKNLFSNLSQIMNDYYAIVGLSATLTPIEVYKKILFGSIENIELLVIKNYGEIFKDIEIYIDPQYSSIYIERSVTLLERMAENIAKISRSGNTLIFTASYELAEHLYDYFTKLLVSNKTDKNYSCFMLRGDSNSIIHSEPDRICVVFTSQRGMFSEGIEFNIPFSNIVIYGLSMSPPLLNERLYLNMLYSLLKKGDKKHQELKFSLNLVYAINALVQSIGRAIRRRNKVRVYIFERRFLRAKIAKYMPSWFRQLIKEKSIVLYKNGNFTYN